MQNADTSVWKGKLLFRFVFLEEDNQNGIVKTIQTWELENKDSES